jgi:Cu-processing system ATP-binding protein
VIEIRGLRKRFGALEVLRDLDLHVARGRITAVAGPNAAGKTTLMKVVLGLVRADAGAVEVDGSPVGEDPAYRSRIGYMPQIARFPENLTASELLAMLTDLRAATSVVDDELVARFQLDAQMRKPLRTLSGGTRQKVNAVLAFLFDPDLLILDEPTSGLDPVSSAILKDKVLAARDNGKTVILTSHVMSELDEMAEDIVFLLDGGVRFAGSVRDLKVRTRQLVLERAIAQVMRGEAA